MEKTNPKHVVIAWELGAGFGHFALINGLLERLLIKNYKVSLVVQDINLFTGLDLSKVSIYQAPLQKITKNQIEYQCNYSDVLFDLSYHNPELLASHIYAWKCLLSLLKPDLLICNFAPTAVLAAHTLNCNVSNIATGFGLPLLLNPLPALRSWVPEAIEKRKNSDIRLLSSINKACVLLGHKQYKSVSFALETSDKVLITFPELDPYVGRGDLSYWGALFSTISQNKEVWKTPKKTKVIIYLKNNLPKTEFIFNSLLNHDCEVMAYFEGGLIPNFYSKELMQNISVVKEALNLELLLKEASCVVCSAGHGLVANSLLHGVPMLLMPTNLEQKINTESVKALNAGMEIEAKDQEKDVAKKLNQILDNETYKKGAQEFQKKYENYQCSLQFEAIIEHYESLL